MPFASRNAICFSNALKVSSSLSKHITLIQCLRVQGGKDTQILHTNSEDMSSDSPTQGKVEEQSSFKVCSEVDVLSAAHCALMSLTHSNVVCRGKWLVSMANMQMQVGKFSQTQLPWLMTKVPH